jgi:hypothetical protein
MSSSHRRGRRTLVARLLRFVWRCLKVVLMSFAALGPAPPPPPVPRPPTVEQREEGRPAPDRPR